MLNLVKEAVYENYLEEEINNTVLSAGFHKDLKKLIANIVGHHVPSWRRQVSQNQISLPRLESFDWRVDIKSASDLIGNISVPTVLVEMKVITYSYFTRFTI
jgi:COMM domain containing 9